MTIYPSLPVRCTIAGKGKRQKAPLVVFPRVCICIRIKKMGGIQCFFSQETKMTDARAQKRGHRTSSVGCVEEICFFLALPACFFGGRRCYRPFSTIHHPPFQDDSKSSKPSADSMGTSMWEAACPCWIFQTPSITMGFDCRVFMRSLVRLLGG